jgi:hypothetical protein
MQHNLKRKFNYKTKVVGLFGEWISPPNVRGYCSHHKHYLDENHIKIRGCDKRCKKHFIAHPNGLPTGKFY